MLNNALTASVNANYLFIDSLIIAGSILLSLVFAQTSAFLNDAQRENLLYVMKESLPILMAMCYLFGLSLVSTELMLVASIFSFFALLYWGVKTALPVTTTLGWGHLLFFIAAILLSASKTGNMHFSEQLWYGKLAWLELLFCAWSVLFVYQSSSNKQSAGIDLAEQLRIYVYMVIPLLFLPGVIRLYPEYLAVAIWLSFSISWLMQKKLEVKEMVKETLILFFAAFGLTLLHLLLAVKGNAHIANLIALFMSVSLLAIFNRVEGIRPWSKKLHSLKYRYIHYSSPFLYNLMAAALVFFFSKELLLGISVLSIGFTVYLLQKSQKHIISNNLEPIYFTTLFLCFLPLLKLAAGSGGIATSVSTSLISLAILYLLSHREFVWSKTIRDNFSTQRTQIWAFHLFLFGFYLSLSFKLSGGFGGLTSVLILIHAVTVLFMTLRPLYKELLNLSIVLYVLVSTKILFYDIRGMENLEKIVALMIIGAILMVSAYLFQKQKNKHSLNAE